MKRPLKFFLAVLAMALWLDPANCGYAGVEMFIKIGDIKGEVQDPDYAGWSEVLSWSWGVGRAASASAAGAGDREAPVQALPFVITKVVDKASPKLMEACAKGMKIPSVVLAVRRTEGTNAVEVLKVRLTYVLINQTQWDLKETRVATTAAATGTAANDQTLPADGRPAESLVLSFAISEVDYQPTDSGGKPTGELVAGTVTLPTLP